MNWGRRLLSEKYIIMERDKSKMLRHGHSVVIGKVLAGLMEKVPVHLKSLQTSACRLAGFFDRTKQEIGEDGNKFDEILSGIDRHIDLLARKVQILNRFSQRMASSPAVTDLGEIIEETVLFSSRLAHLHDVSIKLELDENLPKLHNNPVGIHFLVSKIINWMITKMRGGGQLIVRARDEEGGVLIDVEGQGHSKEGSSSERDATDLFWPIAQGLIENLEGRWVSETNEYPIKRMSMFLPNLKALAHTQI
jgi:hypothetical protein